MYLTDRVIDLEEGQILIATDIHGNWRDYSRLLERYDAGAEDRLVIMGDIVHPDRGVKDRSKLILDDLIARGANHENSDIIVLMGNHDMVHPYHVDLSKHPIEYSQRVGKHRHTRDLEEGIKDDRERYMDFFRSMPFAVRTAGGVLLTHVGPTSILGKREEGSYKVDFETFKSWSHEDLLAKMVKKREKSGKKADTTSFNHKLGKELFNTKRGRFLYEFLFSKNEREFGKYYAGFFPGYFDFMGTDHELLSTVVTGHLKVRHGVHIVNPQQLRISTSAGVANDADKAVLSLDADASFGHAGELVALVESLHTEN